MERSLAEHRVTQALEASPILQDAVIAESSLMELLTIAATEESKSARWERYEELKTAASSYVGWDAQREALRTTSLYDAFIEALDNLLPEPLEDRA